MNIEGLDYNTQREYLVLPEYGREIQKMVDYAIELPTKEERQHCAEHIVATMDRMKQQNRNNADHIQKLWDHLAIMSHFELAIDYPYDVSGAMKISDKPEPMNYPMNQIPVRHYGVLLFELFDKLKTIEPGEERNYLVKLVANQMMRCLIIWGHGSKDKEIVASDLAKFTDGKIQLDLETFKFEKFNERELIQNTKKKK